LPDSKEVVRKQPTAHLPNMRVFGDYFGFFFGHIKIYILNFKKYNVYFKKLIFNKKIITSPYQTDIILRYKKSTDGPHQC